MGAAGSEFIINWGTKLYIAPSAQAIAASLCNNDSNIIKFEFFVQII